MRVPAHGVRVLAVRKSVNRPRIIGTDRHVAQTGFEILDEKWDEATKTLTGKVSLVKDFPTTVAVHVPTLSSYCTSVKADGAKVSHTTDNNSVKLTLTKSPDNKSGAATFELKF